MDNRCPEGSACELAIGMEMAVNGAHRRFATQRVCGIWADPIRNRIA
jgi:hypothetical protein